MAVEASIKDDFIFIYGESNTTAILDYEKIALQTIKSIGYEEEYIVYSKVNKQSQEISNAINKDNEINAGDQGIMFGYACDDTEDYMPAPIYYANKLANKLSEVQKTSKYLGPDGKTQVTVEYVNNIVKRIHTIVVSTQHIPNISLNDITKIILKDVVKPVIPKKLVDEKTEFLINPSGSFVKGGSFGDSGTTGRKIVADTYGGMGRIGGVCFSSKDPSKVDRSAAYYCRYVAKNIVAHGLAKKCEIQVSYVIGKPQPINITVDTFGTALVNENEILKIINNNFDFRVENIIKELDLKKPIYSKTTNYGHFGHSEYSWEHIKKFKEKTNNETIIL